jgi:hypothetical protein
VHTSGAARGSELWQFGCFADSGKSPPSVAFCRCMFCGPPTAACDLQGHEGKKEFDVLRICNTALVGMWIMDQFPSMRGQLAHDGME